MADSQVMIYTTDYCPYCTRAKNLLKNLNIPFEEKLLTTREEINELKQRTKMMTVPQIFIKGKLIGGYTELSALYDDGELEKLME
jgi:glutaredoxin 3